MGISDKISGRAKKAAGDLTGNDSLRREGAQEERKDQAKEELAAEERRAENAEARVQRKEKEVDDLEHRTDSDQLEADRSKEELYDEAQELGVEGRSEMNKDELADEVSRRK
jgi:uncharacterized protein YjbJ (UPF0337 family)